MPYLLGFVCCRTMSRTAVLLKFKNIIPKCLIQPVGGLLQSMPSNLDWRKIRLSGPVKAMEIRASSNIMHEVYYAGCLPQKKNKNNFFPTQQLFGYNFNQILTKLIYT